MSDHGRSDSDAKLILPQKRLSLGLALCNILISFQSRCFQRRFCGAYEQYMRLTVKTERQERSVAGTVFSDGKPRIIQVRGINMEAALDDEMLYIENTDKPGFIGALGTLLGEAGVNIANFNLGREEEAGRAIALIGIDQAVEDNVLAKTRDLQHVVDAKRLHF